MSDATLDAFVALSAALTGFPQSEIGGLDPDQLASVYYDFVRQQDGDLLDRVLEAFKQAQADSGGDPTRLVAAVGERIVNDTKLGPLTKKITRLWYLGRWRTRQPDGSTQDDFVSDPRLSAPDAPYIRALAWKAMDAKAIGYSEFTDQYWARPPEGAEEP